SPVILKDIRKLTNKPQVCLTFDDGPDPAFTPRILDVLAEHKALATFFVLGEAAERFPKLVERMVDAGHTVGNHTFSHCHPWMCLPSRARQEVAHASDVIKDIIGYAPRWFRPPHGRLRTAMINEADAENMTTVLWSHSIIDWGPLGTEAGINERLQAVTSGDIVLMHDGERQHNHPDITAQQLPKFLESLLNNGVTPVTLDQVA
ncbi:MAG: polysaccharide deacetylase family protein, partial [Moraxellaceae bacterium]